MKIWRKPWCSFKNKLCGSFGHLSIFSFYANKLITTGEGGMILTDSKNYQKLKLLSLGFNNKKDLSMMY